MTLLLRFLPCELVLLKSLPVGLSIQFSYLSFQLAIYPSIHLPTSVTIYPCIYLFISLCIYLFRARIHLLVHLYLSFLSMYLLVYVPVRLLAFYPSV